MESLVKALPWIAQGVARSCGVKVRFDQRATTASLSRDGVITLPTIPVGDETASTLALGYIVHEAAGHRCFSDFEVLDQAVGGPEETLFRIIEDCRIERAAMRAWPGGRSYLTDMWEIFYTRGQVSRPSEASGLVQEVCVWVLAQCRFVALGLAVAMQDAAVAKGLVEARCGSELVQQLENVLAELATLGSSADALMLARRLLQVVYAWMKQRQADAQVPGGNPEAAANAEPALADAKGPQSDGSPADASTAPDAGNEASVQTEGTHPLEGSGAWDMDGDFVDMVQRSLVGCIGDAGPLIKTTLSDAIVEAKFKGVRNRPGHAQTQMGAAELVAADSLSMDADGAALMEAANAHTMALRSAIRNLLGSIAQVQTRYAGSGRLRPTRLWKLKTGNTKVFQQERAGVKLDTAITVLVDVSGSMRRRLRLACEACIATASAMEGIPGIKVSVAAFPYKQDSMKVGEVKGFRQSVLAASGRFASLRAQGETPLAEALYCVGHRLRAEQGEARVLIVLTDGQPDDPDAARAAIDCLRNAGIEMIGLGIGCDVSQHFDRHTRIDNAADLAGAMFGVLEQRFRAMLQAA